ncbi:MAG: DUF945 domain-containing protein [Sphingobacteriia bacterium]|nr:DUF945 domain-containing protein [Sphingobacteriia bacterium]
MHYNQDKLWKFQFPIVEKQVFVEDDTGKLIVSNDYKAITREDNGKLISIMSDSYKVVPNNEIIKPLLDQLSNFDSRWYIDDSHSFVSDERMRLQVTFPELVFNDGASEIALSLFLHNSYNGSEGVRSYFGAIRGICSNGMVFGQLLAKYYAKHTSGLSLDHLKQQVEQSYENIPVIQNKIEALQNDSVNKALTEAVEKRLGKGVVKYVNEQPIAADQWQLYNQITHFISHEVQKPQRAAYQLQVSKIFAL